METGTVKWVQTDTKGCGRHPTKDGGGEDVFCHHTAIKGQEGSVRSPRDQKVEFEVVKGPKGLQDQNVRKRR